MSVVIFLRRIYTRSIIPPLAARPRGTNILANELNCTLNEPLKLLLVPVKNTPYDWRYA